VNMHFPLSHDRESDDMALHVCPAALQ
jgi:hypothetical protein